MARGCSFGKGALHPLIGGALLIGIQGSLCVTCYSTPDGLSQNMEDYDPLLNVLSIVHFNGISSICGSASINPCLPLCSSGFMPHHFIKTYRAPTLRMSGCRDFHKRRLTQHFSRTKVSVPIGPSAKERQLLPLDLQMSACVFC